MPHFSPRADCPQSLKRELKLMEPSQIKQQIADLTERANALRGYL
jgi:hypothetical protein